MSMMMIQVSLKVRVFFFFNDTATTEIYTLSLHDALPISVERAGVDHGVLPQPLQLGLLEAELGDQLQEPPGPRSEEHTSELQSRQYLVCRLLLEKKKQYHLHSHLVSSHTSNLYINLHTFT